MTTQDAALARLDAVSQGFRTGYLDYDRIASQLRAWAEAFPAIVRLRSIGTSVDGRDLWVISIGPEPDRVRPSVWIDGNMHASEVCGSSVALAIAEDVIRLHLAPGSVIRDLPAHLAARVREVLFHVLPRMSPDGAESVLRDGRYVRSNPRDRRKALSQPRWVSSDVDGDGVSMSMRVRDPAGEFAESTEVPGMLVPRQIEDTGPFYKLYPEGLIEPFDGLTVPDPYFLSDNDTDLNRNFPWAWTPEPEQEGAGSYPTSEPESRAVVEFVTARPEIFAWLNLHTFGGVFIRPLGHASDKKMDPFDLAVYRQIGEWGEALTGYPMVSGFEDFLYEPDKPLHGDLSSFGYHNRGCIAYVCELWDLFKQIGMERQKPFTNHYTHWTRADMVKLGRWDAEHNQSRIFRPWKPCTHPQLGAVEVGGIDIRVGVSNPPYEMIADVCAKQSAMFLRVASLAPAVSITRASVTRLADQTRRIDVSIENTGYLPTFVLPSSKPLPFNEPLYAAAVANGCTLASRADERREVGHLNGWGQGKFGTMTQAPFFQRSRGNGSARVLSWVVSGRGTLTVRVGSCRVGFVEKHIEVE